MLNIHGNSFCACMVIIVFLARVLNKLLFKSFYFDLFFAILMPCSCSRNQLLHKDGKPQYWLAKLLKTRQSNWIHFLIFTFSNKNYNWIWKLVLEASNYFHIYDIFLVVTKIRCMTKKKPSKQLYNYWKIITNIVRIT